MSRMIARFHPVPVTPVTTWVFISLSDGETIGWGEATLNGREQALRACFDALPDLATVADFASLKFDTLPHAAVSSALAQARADLNARRAGLSLSESLGGPARTQIGVYANINRCTRDRSPAGFAASARRALAQGHAAIKIAPFDEVSAAMDRPAMTDAMGAGIARIAAVRDTIGDRRLMVDCHWRFDPDGAAVLIEACADLNLYWIECPIRETVADIPAILSLRRKANAAGIRLAGLETAIRRDGFAPYLEAGAYDVMMPDVKYCGGPHEMLAIAADMARHGVAFSPHNPSGPVCHLHSLHLCATLGKTDLLETQFDETPMFDRLVGADLPGPRGGYLDLPGTTAGLGRSVVLPDSGA